MGQSIVDYRRFPDEIWSASRQHSQELGNRVFNALQFRFDASLTTTATAITGVFTDPLLKLLGRTNLELTQSDHPIIKMTPQELFWLGAIIDGMPGRFDMDDAIGASTSAAQVVEFWIDFQKLYGPACMIDAREVKVARKGAFGSLSDYGQTALSSVAGTLRTMARSSQREPTPGSSYLRPQFYSERKDISTSSTKVQHSVRIGQTGYLAGLMFMVTDDSAGGSSTNTNAQASRADGLIRNVTARLLADDFNGELGTWTWGQLVDGTWRGESLGAHGGSAALTEPMTSRPSGVAWLPLRNEADGTARGARLFKVGDVIELDFDTQSTPEADFTAVTPAANDIVSIVVPLVAPVATRAPSDKPGSLEAQRAVSAPVTVRRGLGG